MFQYQEKVLYDKTFQFSLMNAGQVLSYRQVLDYWQNNDVFREFYTSVLLEVPFNGFFWENRAVSRDNIDEPYQFIIRGTKAFYGKLAHAQAFSAFFDQQADTVTFDNQSGDAHLIVPVLRSQNPEHYIHLGAFLRNAKSAEIHELWQKVGTSMQQRIGEKPLWLSTSGLGVFWLHIRIDQRPKYYTHRPYRF